MAELTILIELYVCQDGSGGSSYNDDQAFRRVGIGDAPGEVLLPFACE